MISSTANVNDTLDKISSAIQAAKRASITIDSAFNGDIFACIAVEYNINSSVNLQAANAYIKLNALLKHIYCITPATQAMNDDSAPIADNTTVIQLISQLTVLSLEAPSNIIDVSISIAGHVKNIIIIINTDCSIQMYLDGKQPKPVTHINFSMLDKQAEQHLRDAIITVQDLMLKHKEQNKDAA